MELDNDFYEKWKKRSTNKQFFSEQTTAKEKCSQNNKIFSSTALQDQTDTESFSLHLSESYVDETPETTSSQAKQEQVNEIILISDSSIEESVISFDKTSKLLREKKTNFIQRKDIHILESSEDESIGVVIQQPCTEKNKKFGSIPNSPVKQNSRKNVIEESDSDIEQSRVPDLIKETVAESVTLSDRKKKEILQWLSTNFDGSRCGSSCSQESVITSSRKSGISSGNSSLERLELNFETPNNRGKLSKPSTTEKSNRRHKIDTEKQSTIDQYFNKTKKGHLDIVKDKTPGSKHSDKTPVNKMKCNPRKILSELDSLNSGTPTSRNSDKTPMNVKTKQRIIIPESESFESKNQENAEKILVPESESLGSQNNAGEKHIIISESESSDSPDIIKSYKKNLDLNYNSKSTINQTPQSKDVMLAETVALETSSDADILNSSSDINKKNKENQEKNQAQANTTINTTLNDCADILENLYGTAWRNKAKVLVSATEPKKQTTKKIFNTVQTEKKITFRKPRFDYESDDSILNKKNDVPKKISQTESKKPKSKKKVKDNFINDSTTESSPDCSYYTAMSNPVTLQNNPVKTKSTIKANDKKKVLRICDSDSEPNNEIWKIRGKNQRKLSFDSSTTSSTSEFDPEDIVPPKMKSTKIAKKPINCQAAKTKTIQQPETEVKKKGFLASLSKDVPLEEADFKAMTYRVKYKTMKEELCKVLFKLFNEKVFDNQLPDDMAVEWSVRLRGTAGKCYNKQSVKALGKTVRSSRLVLATKILDSPDRLRDTLIHEMCHAATWMINNISDGHGSFWKAWAHKAMKVFPELPPISRCHNYEIQTKYTYKCSSCGYSIGRHSKSLDLNRKRCGYCHGTFELLVNKVTKDGTVQKKSAAQKKPSGFALYVKENYHIVKQNSTPTVKHAELMKILGQQFSAVKLTPKPEDRMRNNQDESP